MTIPTYKDTRQPILEHLARLESPVKMEVLIRAIAQHFKLTPEEMVERTDSGRKKFAGRMGVAVMDLKSSGLISSPRHSYMEITQKGRESIGTTSQLGREEFHQTPSVGSAEIQTATQTEVSIPDNNDEKDDDAFHTASEIFKLYIAKNEVSPDRYLEILEKTYQTVMRHKKPSESLTATQKQITGSQRSMAISQKTTDLQTPAVPITESVKDDYIVCLDCGQRFKALKRHIWANHNMMPDAYRKKWRLPPDYPMVAPGYAKTRKEIARQFRPWERHRTDEKQ